MRFYIGQTVELVNNDSMAAEKGATAIVIGAGLTGLNVKWLTKFKGQIDGYYCTLQAKFKPFVKIGEQLEFSFMKEDLTKG